MTLSAPSAPTRSRIAHATSFEVSELIALVAPNRFAISSLLSRRSIAITGFAPTMAANWITFRPTPPTPKTTTDSPIPTWASLLITPSAVVTAQPSRGALLLSIDAGTGVTRFSDTTAYSLKVVTQPALTFLPFHE